MLTIDASSGKKPLNVILKEHNLILSREIIHCVCDAIDMGISQINIAIIKMPGNVPDMPLQSFESFYREALQNNMKPLIENEEYELCAKAIDYINRIDEMHQITV